MSELKENIKKYLVNKFVNLAMIIFILILLFTVVIDTLRYNQIAGFIWLAIILIGFYFLSEYINGVFDKWEVPKLNREDKKSYLSVDTIYSLSLLTLLIILLWRYVNGYILIGIFLVMFSIKEFNKWRKFKKEVKMEGIRE